jgi:hypothetical protein
MDWKNAVFLVSLVVPSGGARLAAHAPADEMAVAGERFLAALTPEQRAKTVWSLDSAERLNWHFVPRAREGVSLKELTPAQRHLATGLLGTALSQRGLLKAATIMSLETVLAELEQGRGPVRDPELYYVTIFGQPESDGTWAWRFEGHHLSLHLALRAGEVVGVTPSFLGSNPGEVREGPRRGLRVLGEEEDLARELARSLSEAQWRSALIATSAPADIVLSPERRAEGVELGGLAASQMTAPQAALLRRLIAEYVRRYRAEVADDELRRIEAAGFDKIRFAWAGALEPRRGHYYRVQGPTFVLEYDNTQNQANHIHTVWRDLERDFGGDLLRRHYETQPHPH